MTALCIALACGEPADAPAPSDVAASNPHALPALTPGQVEELAKAVTATAGVADPDHRGLLAARAFAEIEAARLPVVADAFESIVTSPPEMRTTVLSQAMADLRLAAAFEHLCPDHIRFAKSLAEQSRAAQGATIESGCALSLATPEHRARSEPAVNVFVHIALSRLELGGTVHDHERALLTSILEGSAG